jgi:hypothetical protein
MTERVRVFVSHSALDAEEATTAARVRAHEIRKAICAALKKDDRYYLLIDEVNLTAGDSWRAHINLWLRLCDAAVLVISPDALKSHYVAFEANVLGFRKTRQPDLLIIPVLAGVSMVDVHASPLNPSQIGEWQAEVRGTPEEIAAAVLERLEGLEASDSRPSYQLASLLELLFPDSPVHLKNADLALDIGRIPWSIEGDRIALAQRMLGCGMSDPCATAINYFREAPATKFPRENLQPIGDHVAAAWVDLKAELIPLNAKSAAPKPMLLNAAKFRTAMTYMNAARHLISPYLLYDIVEPPAVIPEQLTAADHEEQILTSVRKELVTKYGSEARMLRALDSATRLGKGVIVVLHEEALTPTVLPRLRNEFPKVAFFVLGGPRRGAIVGVNDNLVITPELADEDESRFLERYETFHSDIGSE